MEESFGEDAVALAESGDSFVVSNLPDSSPCPGTSEHLKALKLGSHVKGRMESTVAPPKVSSLFTTT